MGSELPLRYFCKCLIAAHRTRKQRDIWNIDVGFLLKSSIQVRLFYPLMQYQKICLTLDAEPLDFSSVDHQDMIRNVVELHLGDFLSLRESVSYLLIPL